MRNRPSVHIAIVALIGFAAFSTPVSADEPKQSRPPNVIIIYADDLGYGDLGCYGGKIATPNLDRMARQGIRFTDFYVAQPVCSASRVSVLTGKYPNRAGILGALGPKAKNGLTKNERTIADLLKALGYRTGIVGKWHLGHLAGHLPGQHGFDEYFGLPYSNDMWPKHPTAKFPDLPLIEGDKVIARNPDQSRLTTWYTEHAVKFIEKNKDGPFFLYLAHTMPHVPLFVSERYKGKSTSGLFGDVVMELDWSVGQILQTLARLGLDDNTLVIFASDNGPWLSYGNHAGSAGRLREGKLTTWEGGVRVPFIARWPGKIPAGRTCREPAMTIDLLPTIVRLTGASLPPHKIDGKDISPLLLAEPGARSPHEAYFFYWNKELHAVRSGAWKLYFPHKYSHLIKAGNDGKPGVFKSIQTGLELYNLEKDIGETTNVAAQNPDVVGRLEVLAARMRADLGDSLAEVNAVRRVLEDQVEAWNKGDLTRFMAGYWKSPQLSFYSGDKKTKGWQATLDRYRKKYQGEGKEMGKLAFAELDIDVLGGGHALVRGRFELTLSRGKVAGLFTLICRKTEAGWRIIHDHTSSETP